MQPLDHFIKRDKDKRKEGLDRDMFSHNNLGDTLKSVFNPTPQVAQQRREAVKTFITTPAKTTRSDMIGSTAMIAGRTLTQQAPISQGAGALIASKVPILDKRTDMVGSMGAGLITGRAIAAPIKTPIWKQEGMVKPTTINYGNKYTGVGAVQTPKKGALGEQLREGVYWDKGEYMSPAGKRYSWASEPMSPQVITKDGSIALQPKGGVKSLPFEAISTIPSFKNDLGMRPPTLQSPGRISTPIQVASSDKFLPNTSGNAMQNIGALSAAGSKSLGSWLTGGK